MPNTFHGYIEGDGPYNRAYRGLNPQEYVGEFRVLSHSKRQYTNDEDGSYRYVIRIKAPKGATREQVQGVVWNEFDHSCRCEHDCCGHYQRRTGRIFRPANRAKGEWIVPINAYPNI